MTRRPGGYAANSLEARVVRAVRAAEIAGQTVYGFSIKPNEIMVLTRPLEPRVYVGAEDAADRYFREKGIG
jgi:hypothetical protein